MTAERRAQSALAAYLLAVVGITFIHHLGALAALLVIAFIAAGSGAPARPVAAADFAGTAGRSLSSRARPGIHPGAAQHLLMRTLRSVFFFNATVSIGYAAIASWRGDLSWHALALINLRVLLLVFLGFWFVARVNVLQALAFSPTLVFVATLASGQAQTFARIVRDFRLAFTSRQVGPTRWRDHTRHAGAQAVHLLDKAVANAAESAQAMRARGCFDE